MSVPPTLPLLSLACWPLPCKLSFLLELIQPACTQPDYPRNLGISFSTVLILLILSIPQLPPKCLPSSRSLVLSATVPCQASCGQPQPCLHEATALFGSLKGGTRNPSPALCKLSYYLDRSPLPFRPSLHCVTCPSLCCGLSLRPELSSCILIPWLVLLDSY